MSRETRRLKAARFQEPRKRGLWLFVVLLASAILALVTTSTKTPEQPRAVGSRSGKLPLPQSTDEEKKQALLYAAQFIEPVIIKHMADPNELPAIGNRLRSISQQIQAKRLEHMVIPVRNPWQPSSVAKFDWDSDNGKPAIMAFIPQIKQDRDEFVAKGRPQDFEDYLVLSYAHEVIHQEILGRNPQYEAPMRSGSADRSLILQNEAEAWGITIIEIVRPMLLQSRYVPRTIDDASVLMKEYSDNYLDPNWILAFEAYHPK